MAFTSPPTAVTGAVIEAADINVFRDNDNWFNALVPSPSGVGQLLRSTSTSAAGFVNDGAGSDIDADLLDGQHGSYYASATDLAALAVAAFPSGVGGWVRKASEIPTGFTRESALDGRIPVGAGTTFTVTYVEETNYGASWSHGHTTQAHSHSGANLGISGSTGNESSNVVVNSGGGENVANDSHSHNQGSLDVAGNTATDGSGATSSDAWVIPSRAVVWIRKN